MPTIMSSSNPSGPKITLSSSLNTSPTTQPIPHISQAPIEPLVTSPVETNQPNPTPTAAPVPAPMATPPPAAEPIIEAPDETPPAADAATNIADPLSVVSNAEADLIKKLAVKRAEETGLISKMKDIISETSKIEESEVGLQKQLEDLQAVRRKIEDEPDSAAELLKKVGLAESEVQPTVDKSAVEKPPTESPAPVTQPTAAATPQQPLQPISPVQRVLNALQSTFGSGDAAIAAMLTADATVERAADKNGVVVSGAQGQVHFSNDDIKQAGIALLELSDIPYAIATTSAPVTQPVVVPPIQPVTPAPAPTPTSAPPAELTSAMKSVIAKLEKNPPASVAPVIKSVTTMYRSPDGNGLLVMSGMTTVHVPDAELIQADVTAEDISDLPNGSPEMMPV